MKNKFNCDDRVTVIAEHIIHSGMIGKIKEIHFRKEVITYTVEFEFLTEPLVERDTFGEDQLKGVR